MDKRVVNEEVRQDTHMTNNVVHLTGVVTEEFTENHDMFGEKFLLSTLKVTRLSKTDDYIPILVSERLMDSNRNYVGKRVEIEGSYRSYNKHTDTGSRLILNVFANTFKELEGDTTDNDDVNEIKLTGFICKKPSLRKTPFGRWISDVLIAVNRSYGKSDYIPTIHWSRNAHWISERNIGDKIEIVGRIQCREYYKTIVNDDGTDNKVKRLAYEVSVSTVKLLSEARVNNKEKEQDIEENDTSGQEDVESNESNESKE